MIYFTNLFTFITQQKEMINKTIMNHMLGVPSNLSSYAINIMTVYLYKLI